MSDSIRVNGNLLSWGSCGFKIDSQRYYGITAISFSEALEQSLKYGMGRHHAPRARTRGKYTVEPLKITAEVQTIRLVQQALAAKASDQRSYGTVEFEVFLEAIELEQQYTADFLRCKWAKNSSNFVEDAEGLYQEVELSTMQISQNGLVLFDATQGNTP